MLETREGGCHCGRVRFRAKVDLDFLSRLNVAGGTYRAVFAENAKLYGISLAKRKIETALIQRLGRGIFHNQYDIWFRK